MKRRLSLLVAVPLTAGLIMISSPFHSASLHTFAAASTPPPPPSIVPTPIPGPPPPPSPTPTVTWSAWEQGSAFEPG